MLNIIIICTASMLTYVSKEMVNPILPIYLTVNLKLAPALVSLIEGITKAFSSIIKFYSGFYSDKKQERKKFIIMGVFGALLSKFMLFSSNNWVSVILSKTFERFGKAMKLSPQDAILIENSPDNKKGLVLGLKRSFDKFGAAIGIIIAYFIIVKTVSNYKIVFFISVIPVFIATILSFFIKQEKSRRIVNINLNDFSLKIKTFFIIAFVSALANSTETVLLLKAFHSGFSASEVILLYFTTSITTCLIAYPVGRLCDKVSKYKLVALSYFIFGITYLGFGLTNNSFSIIILFILYGIFEALIAVSAKAFIASNIPNDMKATALGVNECLVGLASLPASIIAGGLWHFYGPTAPFYFSALLAFISSYLVIKLLK